MLKYMGNVTLALALQCFIIYQVLLFVFTRLNPIKFVKKFLPVMGFAFSTATSNATIPMSIDTLNKKMGVSKQQDRAEERLVTQIMRDNGNSVDFTA